MAVTGNTNNQTKRHGGTNAISLKGNSNNGLQGFLVVQVTPLVLVNTIETLIKIPPRQILMMIVMISLFLMQQRNRLFQHQVQ